MAKNDKGNSEKQWLVQWKGFPASAQTWEPLENLSGCEAFIARFNEEREANERADLEKRRRTRDAQEEERQKKQKSESGTALLDSATSAPCRLKQVGELRLSGQLSQKTVGTQGLPDVSCTEEMESAAFESNTAVALQICEHI